MEYNLKLGMLRKNAGYTQSQAAEKLGISKSALASYEKDSDKLPLSVFIKMAELYDFDVYTIAGVKENEFEMDVPMYYNIKAHAKYQARHICLNDDEYKTKLEQLIYKAIKEDKFFNKAKLLMEFEKDKEKGILRDSICGEK